MIYEELVVTIEQAARSQATSLDLSGQALKELPAEIGQLNNLESLNLSRNQLDELPAEISRMTDLKYIGLTQEPSQRRGF